MITVYSADWCGYCRMVKNYFDGLKIEYTEKNVEHDAEIAKEAVDKSGQMGIPVIDMDGTIIVGFDKATIDQRLKELDLVK